MNPILFEIGIIQVYWYSALILAAFLIALFIATKEGKRLNVRSDFIFNMAFWTIIVGIIGARLYYVLFHWDFYGNNLSEIYKIWNGGLAIHGGLIAGFLMILFYTRKYKVKTFKITDIVVVSLLLAQAIGRWGNLFNSEALGSATTLERLQAQRIPEFIINGMYIDGVYYTPTFLYESLWCLLGFVIFIIYRRYKYIKIGQLTALYLIWYGAGRFFIEISRTDSLMLGGFKAAQVISFVMVVVGMLAFMILSRKGKFEYLYNEKESEIRM